MPLDRISSATPYVGLALVEATTAAAPTRARTPSVSDPATARASAPADSAARLVAAATRATAEAGSEALPPALQAREDRLGRNLDVSA